MALREIWNDVRDSLPEDVRTGLEWNAGPRSADRAGAPPRITVEFGHENLVPHRGAGPPPRSVSSASPPRPAPLWVRESVNIVELWVAPRETDGEDATSDAVEELLQHFIAALHRVAYGAYSLDGGGQWLVGGSATDGMRYMLTVTLRIPVTREPEVTQVITSMPQTDEIVSSF